MNGWSVMSTPTPEISQIVLVVLGGFFQEYPQLNEVSPLPRANDEKFVARGRKGWLEQKPSNSDTVVTIQRAIPIHPSSVSHRHGCLYPCFGSLLYAFILDMQSLLPSLDPRNRNPTER